MSGGVAYRVGIAQTFQEALKKRPTHTHAVMEAVRRLQEGHSGVHLHALEGVPWVAFNVNRDALRIVAARDGQSLLLAWVDTHDEAYSWAKRHKPLLVGHHIELVRVPVRDDAAAATSAVTPADVGADVPVCPLKDVRDRVFHRFGVDDEAAAVLRSLSEAALLSLLSHFTPATGEALLGLASDPDDLEGIVARHEAARAATAATATPATLADAMASPQNTSRVWLLPDDVAAVEKALSAGEAWQLFLHPSQRRLVDMAASGPVLVTGGPGTGKTVVALHRARALLRRRPPGETRPLLVTTFSRVLARQLEEGLRRLCADAPGLLEGVEVKTLTQAARDVVARAGQPSALLLDEDLDAAWAGALENDVAGRGRAFYELERRDVVLPQGIVDEAGYLKAKRAGRGARLDRAARVAIWRVLSAFEAGVRARGGDDATGLGARAIHALLGGAVPSPWWGVVCDEVQDASLVDLRLLSLVGGPNLFLVGDGHQRLYTRPVSLRAAGIEVRGRSVRLRLNYRTTQGICRAAVAVMDGVDLDTLDVEARADGASDDAVEHGGGYRSVRAGPLPERHVCADADAEADVVADVIRASSMADGAAPTLVLARTRAALSALQERLRVRGLTVALLGDGVDSGDVGGVPAVLATLHRAKGLEAPTVVLTAMQLVPQPHRGGADDDEGRALHARQERSLVYVGMTRARDRCVLTRVGPAP
jgi:hypothetical protein